MTWSVVFLPEARKDIRSLERSQQAIVKKALAKVSENPLPQSEGGYGKPLGHRHGLNLTNLLKINLRGEGIRIIYKLFRTDQEMLIIVVGIREDDIAYELADQRRQKHNL